MIKGQLKLKKVPRHSFPFVPACPSPSACYILSILPGPKTRTYLGHVLLVTTTSSLQDTQHHRELMIPPSKSKTWYSNAFHFYTHIFIETRYTTRLIINNRRRDCCVTFFNRKSKRNVKEGPKSKDLDSFKT